MPTVKRFRKLGEIRKSEPPKENTISPVPDRKTVRRFRTRATRCDKKHRFTLRIAKDPWNNIKELYLNCGGSETGASLNVIVNMLLEHALNTPEIYESIQKKYPSTDSYIKIRTWGE
jgi:hypothetical protein